MVFLLSGCAATVSKTHFPAASDLFITTGDGDIQKPYTPVGQLFYFRTGFRLAFLPLFGLIQFNDVDPDVELKKAIYKEVRRMGGDGVINLRISWKPPTDGFLGIGAYGGHIAIYGTVIKR